LMNRVSQKVVKKQAPEAVKQFEVKT